jgi:hypothetical protein
MHGLDSHSKKNGSDYWDSISHSVPSSSSAAVKRALA